MTIPEFKPIAWTNKQGDYFEAVRKDTVFGSHTRPLYTADQLTEAYEAGKRDATPEGWVLVPKEPTEEMLRAPWLKIDEQTSFKLKIAHNYYKAMLAATPKGEVK